MSSSPPGDGAPGGGKGGPILAVAMFLLVVGAFAYLMTNARAPEESIPRGTRTGDGGVGGVPAPSADGSGETIVPDGVQPIAGEITYRGRVTDPLSEPLAGVEIISGPYPNPDEVTVTTDADGAFSITLPAATDPVVRMAHPGFYQQVVELEEQREDGIPYLLFRGGVVRGVVTGPEFDEDRNIVTTPVPDVILEFAGAEGWFAETRTDAEGRYTMTAPTGPVVITVRSDAYRDRQILDVTADRREETVHDIALEPGVMLDVALFGVGTAVADAHVRVYTDFGIEGEGRTDAMGKASFPGLTPGMGHVLIVAPGYTSLVYPVVLGDNRPLIRKPISMEPSVPWSLAVVDVGGNPRPDARVRISVRHPERRTLELVTTTADDTRGLDILGPPDEYVIEVSTPDTARTRTTFSLPSRDPGNLKVVLQVGGRFSGKVVDRSGAPVAGVTVLISPTGPDARDRGPARVTTTSARGTFRTERYAPGGYKVQVSHPKLGRVSSDVTVVDGRDVELGTIDIQAE